MNPESDLLQSPNWQERREMIGPAEEGFPFNEGFPPVGPLNNIEFEIIFINGEHFRASVDFSTQYRAEGLRWRIRPTETMRATTLGKHVIAGWCQIAS